MTRSKPVDPNSDFKLVAVPVMIELQPHTFSPDTSAGMGDCKCGRVYDDHIHTLKRELSAPQMDVVAKRMNALEGIARKFRDYRLNDIETEWGDLADPAFDPTIQMIDSALSWEQPE